MSTLRASELRPHRCEDRDDDRFVILTEAREPVRDIRGNLIHYPTAETAAQFIRVGEVAARLGDLRGFIPENK